MPGITSSDPTFGTTSSVGRYFGLVSTMPSVVFTAWIYVLVAAGAWTGAPSLSDLKAHNPVHHAGLAVAALAFAFAVAIVSHPAQFVLVQLMEGYWGPSRLARGLHDRLVFNHLLKLALAERLRDEADEIHRDLPDVEDVDEYVSADALARDPDVGRLAIRWQGLEDSANRIEAGYPDKTITTMPTRLGNVLRSHELIAGRAVGLPVLAWATHIGMVAAPEHTAYVADQRTQLDLAVRTVALGALASLLTFALLWDEGEWALLTLAPYAATVLAYRGAVSAADSYGLALRAWVDLNRFRLYETLGLRKVAHSSTERSRNAKLDDLRLGTDDFNVSLDDIPHRP